MQQGPDPVQAILSRAFPPQELADRVRPLLTDPASARLLPEVLHALGVIVDSGRDETLASELLAQARSLAALAPEASSIHLREALEVGWLFPIAGLLVDLLGDGLPALRADAIARCNATEPHERRRALSLLCALGPGPDAWDPLLAVAVDRAGRLEEQRARTLANLAALPRLVEALGDADAGVRMRAEAALLHLGMDAAPAAHALLRMPPWPGGDERPSPLLKALGEAAMPAIREAMDGDGFPRRRAEYLLHGPPPAPEPNVMDHLAALSADSPAERQMAFEAVFRSWFTERLPPGLRERIIEASLDRLDRNGWLPAGPLGVEATPRGLRRGAATLCWLCLRIEPALVVVVCRVLGLARLREPLVGKLLESLSGHHDAGVARAASEARTACAQA